MTSASVNSVFGFPPECCGECCGCSCCSRRALCVSALVLTGLALTATGVTVALVFGIPQQPPGEMLIVIQICPDVDSLHVKVNYTQVHTAHLKRKWSIYSIYFTLAQI